MKKWQLPFIATTVIAAAILGYTLRPQSVAPKTVKPAVQAQKAPEKAKTPVPTLSADEITKLVNDYRVQNGVKPLTVDPRLVATATEKCLDMQKNNYFDHVNPVTGIRGMDTAHLATPGLRYGGENLVGEATADNSVPVQKWINSPGHRANILNVHYSVTGVAVCADDPNWTRPTDMKFVVQHFAG